MNRENLTKIKKLADHHAQLVEKQDKEFLERFHARMARSYTILLLEADEYLDDLEIEGKKVEYEEVKDNQADQEQEEKNTADKTKKNEQNESESKEKDTKK